MIRAGTYTSLLVPTVSRPITTTPRRAAGAIVSAEPASGRRTTGRPTRSAPSRAHGSGEPLMSPLVEKLGPPGPCMTVVTRCTNVLGGPPGGWKAMTSPTPMVLGAAGRVMARVPTGAVRPMLGVVSTWPRHPAHHPITTTASTGPTATRPHRPRVWRLSRGVPTVGAVAVGRVTGRRSPRATSGWR